MVTKNGMSCMTTGRIVKRGHPRIFRKKQNTLKAFSL